jgi:hypothetical protein
MKRGSTLFLRGVVLLLGILVLALCVFVLPAGIATDNVGGYRFILLGLYVAAIPFFWALYQAFRLLDYIDNNTAFSELSVRALVNIKYSAIVISGLFAAGMPFIYVVAERDDAPGVIAIGLVITFASLVIATFAAVLQKLVQNAVTIKSENDLTV